MSYDDYENGKLDGYNEGYRQGVKDARRDGGVDRQDLEIRIQRIESYLRDLFIPIFDN